MNDKISNNMFLAFIKNTESMIRAMQGQNFEDNVAAQIGMLEEMIVAMKKLKEDMVLTMDKFKEKEMAN